MQEGKIGVRRGIAGEERDKKEQGDWVRCCNLGFRLGGKRRPSVMAVSELGIFTRMWTGDIVGLKETRSQCDCSRLCFIGIGQYRQSFSTNDLGCLFHKTAFRYPFNGKVFIQREQGTSKTR